MIFWFVLQQKMNSENGIRSYYDTEIMPHDYDYYCAYVTMRITFLRDVNSLINGLCPPLQQGGAETLLSSDLEEHNRWITV